MLPISYGMAEYYLNNKPLSDFGIIPSKDGGSIAITGGFDLPKRSGTTFYNWPLENSVDAYVDADDITFENREIKFTGTILGNANNNINALHNYIDSLPVLSELSCKWGSWEVKIQKQIIITPIDRNNSKIEIIFTEPSPNLTGTLPLPSDKNEIDNYSWLDFGLWIESISGGQNIGAYKILNVTQNKTHTLPYSGGRDKTEITINANFLCKTFHEFISKVKSLYSLLGNSGLRKIKYRGIEYTCFVVNGFNISNIIIRNIVSAKFQCKLIVVGKNGIL